MDTSVHLGSISWSFSRTHPPVLTVQQVSPPHLVHANWYTVRPSECFLTFCVQRATIITTETIKRWPHVHLVACTLLSNTVSHCSHSLHHVATSASLSLSSSEDFFQYILFEKAMHDVAQGLSRAECHTVPSDLQYLGFSFLKWLFCLIFARIVAHFALSPNWSLKSLVGVTQKIPHSFE